MEEVEIRVQSSVIKELNEIIKILFHQQYFGTEEASQTYVEKIYDFIEYNLPIFPYKVTPPKLQHLGSYFIFYKANTTTTWYIFFEKSGDDYLITGILNNHFEEANSL